VRRARLLDFCRRGYPLDPEFVKELDLAGLPALDAVCRPFGALCLIACVPGAYAPG
jgi:hypothetical protein